jgi:hypothetical protein
MHATSMHATKETDMADKDQIVELERRIEELQQQQDDLRRQLAEARSDQWQARIDDLDVQAHLGAMEASDRLQPLLEKLRNQWLDARQSFENSTSIASDVIDQLRDGFEQAGRDIRDAINNIRDTARN